MKTFHHSKFRLARLVAKNMSTRTNELVYTGLTSIRSVKTMKFADTTVLFVATHSELNNTMAQIFHIYHKGERKKVQ